ncbi:MAG: hypothetical protein ABSG55_09395 [Dehalococcoidia bacterium]
MEQIAVRLCQHHWVLTEPHNEVINAVCKICRARRDYPARLEMTDRFDDYQELTMGGPGGDLNAFGPLDEEL